MEPLFGDSFIQGTPPLRGHKIWSQKNVHIIIVSVTSIEGSLPFRVTSLISLRKKPTFCNTTTGYRAKK